MGLKMNYAILTEDKDFGEWVFAHHVQGLSVLFLRYFSGLQNHSLFSKRFCIYHHIATPRIYNHYDKKYPGQASVV